MPASRENPTQLFSRPLGLAEDFLLFLVTQSKKQVAQSVLRHDAFEFFTAPLWCQL